MDAPEGRMNKPRLNVLCAWMFVCVTVWPSSLSAVVSAESEPGPADRLTEGPAAAVSEPAVGDPDFLFQRPRVSLGIRSGFFLHRGNSELHEFTTDRFTLSSSDFVGMTLGVEGGVWLDSRLELTFGLDGSRLTRRSSDREWVDDDDGSEIRQTTRVRHGPSASFGVRWYVRDRGERLSTFVWLPSRWNAFVGGGGGITGYRFEQWGDFVDDVDEIIFNDRFASEGSAFFPYVSGGAELGLSPRAALVVEGRYQWGRDHLSSDFGDFDPLDLAGARLTAGLSYRF